MSKSSENLFAGAIAKAATDPVVTPEVATPAAPEPAKADPVVDNKVNEAPQVSELDMLKQRANMMGIKFSNNISLETLKARIQEKIDGEAAAQGSVTGNDADDQQQDDDDKADKPKKTGKTKSLRQFLVEREMRLIRLRITNLDPKKKDLPGEIFTFANEYLGTVRKYVPYGEVTENGFHVPHCIYKQLRDRKFLNIRVRKVRGREIVESNYAREFALEILPALTQEELDRLATIQKASINQD